AFLTKRQESDNKSTAFRVFTGTIYPGKKHERVKVFVRLTAAKDLLLSVRQGSGDVGEQSSSDGSVKVVEWETSQLEAFQPQDFLLLVRSLRPLSAERWQKIGTVTTVDCQ